MVTTKRGVAIRPWSFAPGRGSSGRSPATAEKNYVTLNALQWFINEQLEEVAGAETRLSAVRRAGPGVLMVEAYLAHGGG